jgi:hypothetical protein
MWPMEIIFLIQSTMSLELVVVLIIINLWTRLDTPLAKKNMATTVYGYNNNLLVILEETLQQ